MSSIAPISRSARASSPARSWSRSWRRSSLAASASPLQYGATSRFSSAGLGNGSSRTSEREPRFRQFFLRVGERAAGAHVGLSDQSLVGLCHVIARFTSQRFGGVVLAAVRRADRYVRYSSLHRTKS
jgi:hypothetical protein